MSISKNKQNDPVKIKPAGIVTRMLTDMIAIDNEECANALKLIRETDSVNEAAVKTGFDRVEYFVRSFKKIYGDPPQKFRPGKVIWSATSSCRTP